MLLDLKSLIEKYDLKINGVIHAGAHHGQEYIAYKNIGIKDIVFIEPCQASFQVLKARFSEDRHVMMFNCAIGASSFTGNMHIEVANQGQSNSLLKPTKHIEQYPDIKFGAMEQVRVHRLDELSFDRKQYNMLYMDIQGYELEALKGASTVLKYIDCIYTEVNREELYEGCAQVGALDKYLKDFERVHTDWSGGSWGDALYIRKSNRSRKIIVIPDKFLPNIKTKYPPDNEIIFEHWFYNNVTESELQKSKRYYLPIFWTSYYVNHNYGKNKESREELQEFIDLLDKSKSYFTICQYDDSILNNISGLDIKVFGMSGSRLDYTLPLLCPAHGIKSGVKKDLFSSFIGRNTHTIRKNMISALNGKEGYYLSEKEHSLPLYCAMLERSVFTLCPRGYGQTSFRICEALEYGSIPVYISDEFLIPHEDLIDFEDYGVLIKPHQIQNIDKILRSLSESEVKRKQDMIGDVYEKYYTYEANKAIILNNLG